MYDLRVVVEQVLGFCDLPMRPGDYFEVRGGRISIPEGKFVCLWALQSLMPILPAKQRETLEDNDWLPYIDRLCCPDPDGRVIFRIERIAASKPETVSRQKPDAQCPSKSRGRLLVQNDACTGCQSCVQACEAVHGKDLSRIAVSPAVPGFAVGVCRQCGTAPCVAGCPTGALSRDPLTGSITVDRDRCAGCGACADNCEFDGVRFEAGSTPRFCDLCGGSPSCVDACPSDALGFRGPNTMTKSEPQPQKASA